MGSNNLAARSDGQTVQADDVNQYRNAFMGDHVPRNASGSPEASQGSLGTNPLPWSNLYLTGQIIINGEVVDFSTLTGESHQIISGAALTSGYPDFLTFLASTTTARILGATTSLVAVINNASVTVSSNIDVTGLTVGPSANHTCVVNDVTLTGQESSRLLGEDGLSLAITTVGSAITAKDGTIQVFQKGSEYLLALVDTSNNRIWPFKRGIARTDRATLTNGDTLTLRQGNYIFLDADGSTTYKSTLYPSFSTTEPASPATNQWNFNATTKRWEQYSGSWANKNAHWLGTVICDSSAAVAADSNDFNLPWKENIAGGFELIDPDTLRVSLKRISVAGKEHYLGDFGQTIKMSVSGDRESGVTESANTTYYVYSDSNLKLRFSTIAPRYTDHKLGLYHPKQYWRYLGYAYNDVGSNLSASLFDGNTRSSIRTVTPYPTGHHGSAAPIYASSTTFTVAYIRERDTSDTVNITKATSTTVDVGTVGLNGIAQSANLTGTITVTASGNSVGGVGTAFLTDYKVGDVITTSGGQSRLILTITSNTSMTVATTWTSNESGVAYKRGGRAPSGTAGATWLNLYAITDGVAPGLILSTRNVSGGDSLVDLPSGYTYSAQLTFACRLDGISTPNLVDFFVGGGWPLRSIIRWRVDSSASSPGTANIGTGLTATSFTTLSAALWVPPISRMFAGNIFYTTSSTLAIRETGSSLSTGYLLTGSGTNEAHPLPPVTLDTNRSFDYKVSGATWKIDVTDFYVTEVA